MFGISIDEFLVILVVALVVTSPEKIPEAARALGKLAGKWQQAFIEASQGLKTDGTPQELKETPFSPPPPGVGPVASETSSGRENTPDA